MNKKTAVIGAAVVFVLLGVVVLTLYLLQGQQDVRSRADTPESTDLPSQAPEQTAQQSCPVPAAVQNVQVEFPNCTGDICNFTEASCSWSSVAGATKYQLKITEVDTGRVVKDEQVEAAIIRTVFPIIQGNTYKCDVSAINSCGASGAIGTHSLLCKADAAVVTPTPIPPTVAPPQADCGFPCSSNDNCKTGFICATGTSGQGLCSIPSLESVCQASPSISSCCTAPTAPPVEPTSVPTPIPTLPPTGSLGNILLFGVPAGILVILGSILLFL